MISYFTLVVILVFVAFLFPWYSLYYIRVILVRLVSILFYDNTTLEQNLAEIQLL